MEWTIKEETGWYLLRRYIGLEYMYDSGVDPKGIFGGCYEFKNNHKIGVDYE